MRDRILAAAVTVMRERGVTNTTTKEIARVAGVAEGSIYNHFANKTELVAASMTEVAGGIRDALIRLSGRVGASTVEANLAELAEAEITFFADLLPITGPVLGDHDLREWLHRGGPHANTGTDSPESRRQDTDQTPPAASAAGTGGAAGAASTGGTAGTGDAGGAAGTGGAGGAVGTAGAGGAAGTDGAAGAAGTGGAAGAVGSAAGAASTGGTGGAAGAAGAANLPGAPEVPGGPTPPGRPNLPGGPAPAEGVYLAGGAGVRGGVVRPSQAGQGGVPALGPVLGHVALIGYLEAERQAGRLVAGARPAYLAAALIGACQQYAFVRLLTPPATMSELAGLPPDPAEYAREVVHAILAGHLSDPTYPA